MPRTHVVASLAVEVVSLSSVLRPDSKGIIEAAWEACSVQRHERVWLQSQFRKQLTFSSDWVVETELGAATEHTDDLEPDSGCGEHRRN